MQYTVVSEVDSGICSACSA